MKIMKKFIVFSLLIIFLLGSLSIVLAENNNGNSGSIQTTRSDCGENVQNENHYLIGEDVYIKGKNFNPGIYNWEINGQGNSSCDFNKTIISGIYNVNNSGEFCFNAYTIKEDDCNGYKAYFNGKQDNYRVEQVPLVPEFGIVIGFATLLGAFGVFFVIRKKL